MDALQRASQPSNHIEVSDKGSKTIDVPLIVRNVAGRYSCPSKTCTKDYSRASYARNRYKRVHLNVSMRVACLYDECGKTFFDLHTAKEHHKAEHELIRHDCPADDCDCTFSSPQYARKHYKAVHLLNRIPCAFPGCIDTFSFASAMRNHINNVHAPRWTCPVQTCANTVSEHGVSHNRIAQHMDRHQRLGHLTGLQNPAPKQLSSVSTDITARKEELKMLLLSHGVGHARDGFESEDVICDDGEAESQSLSDDEWTSDDSITFFGMENEESIKMANQLSQHVANSNIILERNLEIAKLFPRKVNYQNYGLVCIGAGILVDGLVEGSCPGMTVLTFETARLVMRHSEKSTRFPQLMYDPTPRIATNLIYNQFKIMRQIQ